MKIAMIGSGAAGSVFAAYLKRGGADMYLVDMYKAHMDKIASEGLRFRLNGEEELLTGFTCAYNASEIGVMDMVIIMVKATQTESIMPTVMPCIDDHTVLISLQNGSSAVSARSARNCLSPAYASASRNPVSLCVSDPLMRVKPAVQRACGWRNALPKAAAMPAMKRIFGPISGARRSPTVVTTRFPLFWA